MDYIASVIEYIVQFRRLHGLLVYILGKILTTHACEVYAVVRRMLFI